MAKRGNTIIDVMPLNSSHSVHVRKIDNGYIRSEHHSDGHTFKSSETFHAENPGLGPQGEAGGVSSETLKGAVAHLKGSK